MDPSYLKDLLWRGREVEFEYGAYRYTVKLVDYRSTSEYAFGRKEGTKFTSDFFDDILYCRDYGVSLYQMLKEISSSSVYVY
ncbi:MAG: hypothetical protein MJ154_01040 [Candidatus Saccharibacteria bacterium]|nr:hypothetical protein [Candidatus Saccharibacteria bacterium]